MKPFQKNNQYKKVDPVDDIRSIARNGFLKCIEEIRKNYKDVKFVMVVDTPTIPIISKLFKMSELVEHSIVLLERYDLERKPMVSYHAIYFLSPQTDIDIFIHDFEKEPIYAAPHLLFTYNPTNTTIEKLNNSPNVVNRILTFSSLYLQFTPMDQSTFLLNCPEAFNSLYSPRPKMNFMNACNIMISGLISFFFNIKAKPLIAYEKSLPKCMQFANEFSRQFNDVYESFPPKIKTKFNTKDTLLIIIPRGADQIAPLLHQFTYEAMIYDHIHVDNETVLLEEGKPDSLLLMNVYEEPSYEDYRYVHLSELLNFCKEKSREYIELQQQMNSSDPKEKSEAIKKLSRVKDAYNQSINRYSMAIKISEINKQKNLLGFAEYEQTLATGLKDGNKVKPSSLELSQQLTKPQLDENDKIRLLAIYNIKAKQMKENDLLRNMESAGISERLAPAIQNLEYLGKQVERSSKKILIPNAFTTDKYNPLVAETINDIIDGESLNEEIYEAPSHSGKYKNIVLFMIGGISYMELRELAKIRVSLKAKKETKLWVGSTNAVYPDSYIAQLRVLDPDRLSK